MADDFDFHSVRKNFVIINLLLFLLYFARVDLGTAQFLGIEFHTSSDWAYGFIWTMYWYYNRRYFQELPMQTKNYNVDSWSWFMVQSYSKNVIMKEINKDNKRFNLNDLNIDVVDVKYVSTARSSFRQEFLIDSTVDIDLIAGNGHKESIRFNPKDLKSWKWKYRVRFAWSEGDYLTLKFPSIIMYSMIIMAILRIFERYILNDTCILCFE